MLGFSIEELTSLAKLLFDGLAILVIVILYIKGNNKRDKEYEKEREEQRKINQSVYNNYNNMIQDIVLGIQKSHLTAKEGKNIAQVEKQINDILNIILKETNASRVSIVKYHNGNKDMTGKLFLKMSMTNEVVNLGVKQMMTEFKEIFRSFLAYWCHEIEINEYCSIADAEQIKDNDINMYQYLISRNIESNFGIGLRDSYNDVIGFVSLEYLHKDEYNEEKIKESLNKNLPKIEALVLVNGGEINEL